MEIDKLPTDVNPQSLDELNASLRLLNKQLSILISYKKSFSLNIIKGIAFTIGASIIAGMIIAFSAQFIHSVEDIPLFNRIIDTVVIQEVLRQYEASK